MKQLYSKQYISMLTVLSKGVIFFSSTVYSSISQSRQVHPWEGIKSRACWGGPYTSWRCCDPLTSPQGDVDCWTDNTVSYQNCCPPEERLPTDDGERQCWIDARQNAGHQHEAVTSSVALLRRFCCGTPHAHDLCWGDSLRREQCCLRLHPLEPNTNTTWMDTEIANDLGDWHAPINWKEKFDMFEQRYKDKICRIRFVDNVVKTCDVELIDTLRGGSRSEPAMQLEEIVKALEILAIPHPSTDKSALPEGTIDFFLSAQIWDGQDYDLEVPVFSKAKAWFTKRLLRIPSHELFSNIITRVGWTLAEATQNSNVDEIWNNRIEKIFWRGGMRSYTQCTCGDDEWYFAKTKDTMVTNASKEECKCQNHFPITLDNYQQHNRIRLVQESERYPDEVDAKFSYIPDTYSDLKPMLDKYIDSGGFSGFEAALRFKYVMSTDGSTIDDTRFYWSFLSGAVVFKQMTPLTPVGIPALEQWVHYIPVREDLADLRAKVMWARANDQKAKEIAQNGFDFAWRHFRQEPLLKYFTKLLHAYVDRFPRENTKENEEL